MAQRGDKCPNGCGGQLIVRTSHTVGAMQVQYLTCNCCGCNAGKGMVPAVMVLRRPEKEAASK